MDKGNRDIKLWHYLECIYKPTNICLSYLPWFLYINTSVMAIEALCKQIPYRTNKGSTCTHTISIWHQQPLLTLDHIATLLHGQGQQRLQAMALLAWRFSWVLTQKFSAWLCTGLNSNHWKKGEVQRKNEPWTLRRMHRENSPVTQTTPEPTLLSWGGWPLENPPSLWYSAVPQMPNLLQISSDVESDFRNGFFSTLHTDLKVESNFYDHH